MSFQLSQMLLGERLQAVEIYQYFKNMSNQRFDEFYLTICKEVGGIQQFADSFFNFLSRKTDFFYESYPGDKMGFPPGYNKQLIYKIMDKYQKEHYKKVPQRTLEEFNRRVEEAKKAKTEQPKQRKQITQEVKPIQQATTSAASKTEQVTSQTNFVKPAEAQKKVTKVEPILSTYNGGQNEKYSWSQEIREVEVAIEIDPSITAKMLKVQFKPNSISIKRTTGETIIEGELVERINTSESVWKVEKTGAKTFITLNLEKAEERIWGTVFKGDPEIDTSKVNNTKPLQDFDDETQGAIRKIMYEQQRKQMGLPTTQEQQQLEALKKAWDAEGSPFKGQPFDPSLINFSGSQFSPK